MAPSTLEVEAGELEQALDTFDWDRVGELCDHLIGHLWIRGAPIEEGVATRVLDGLRRKRQFARLERVAESMLLAGDTRPLVMRQYAQALVDQGRYAAAAHVLEALIGRADAGLELAEARGLLGRVFKQLYVNPGGPGIPGQTRFLHRAIDEYWKAYLGDPARHAWHGVNVAALVARARRDGAGLPADLPAADVIAADVLASLGEQHPPSAFELATRLEAYVALGNFDRAISTASEYVRCPQADAFHLASTERQLREVWRLDEAPDGPPRRLLAILRAMLLARQGGQVTLTPGAAEGDRLATGADAGSGGLRAILGADAFRTLAWYRQGLACCAGVVRIEARSRHGWGTGWIARGDGLSGRWAGKAVLVTNKHVVSPPIHGEPFQPQPGRRALLPAEAVVFHELSNARVPLGERDVLWTSDDLGLDTTVLELRSLPPPASLLELSDRPPDLGEPPGRVYVIGHPAGRGLEFSLHDNVLLACDEKRLHYRAPTTGGSSGSPVFDESWRVIALHHAGGRSVPRLSGDGVYDANEGILIEAIRAAAAS